MRKRLPLSVRILRPLLSVFPYVDGFFSWATYSILPRQYVRTGGCKARGVCCKNLGIELGEAFWVNRWARRWVKWWYNVVYNFKLDHEEPDHYSLVFRCRYLKKNKCRIYKRRPFICRIYPQGPFFGRRPILPGCGYAFKLRKTQALK